MRRTPPLERRFQPVMVGEPSEDEAVAILKGLKDRYEAHHKVTITDEAIDAAVKLSSRYIADRYLPDKAIDLIDEAASRVRLRTFTAPDDLQELEKKIKDMEIDKAAAVNAQDFERAASLRDKEKELQDQLERAKDEWAAKNERSNSVVVPTDIADIVSMWTGVPVSQLTEEESQRLLRLEDTSAQACHRPGGGCQRHCQGHPPWPGGLEGQEPPHWLLHLPGPHRRGQDRAVQGVGRGHVRGRKGHGSL